MRWVSAIQSRQGTSVQNFSQIRSFLSVHVCRLPQSFQTDGQTFSDSSSAKVENYYYYVQKFIPTKFFKIFKILFLIYFQNVFIAIFTAEMLTVIFQALQTTLNFCFFWKTPIKLKQIKSSIFCNLFSACKSFCLRNRTTLRFDFLHLFMVCEQTYAFWYKESWNFRIFNCACV